jgi:hypothetical protein
MVIRADDELRHPSSDVPEWRESMWYCFDAPEHAIGGAIYYAYTPNTASPSARLIAYITKGWNRTPNTLLYSFERDFPIPQQEWNDLDVGGICRFKRLEPLKRWQIGFNDRERMAINLDIDIIGNNWHWIDNVHETPHFLAGDRYHRAYSASGELTLDGTRYPLKVTGDSDHSWGPRRWGPLFKSKYVAGQCGRDWAISLIEILAADGSKRPYGFIWDGKRTSPISGLEITAEYDDDGIHRSVVMNVIDNENRMTRIEGRCFASAPTEKDDVFNVDTYFTFKVNDGQHEGSGILSFYWNREYFHKVMRRKSGSG